MIKSKVFFVHISGKQWQQRSRVDNRPIKFALISTLHVTEASNGMDMFFRGSHQINLYLSGFLFLHSTCHFLPCWSSDSSAFLVLLPSCRFLFLAFFSPLLSPIQHLFNSLPLNSPVFSLFFSSLIKEENAILLRVKGKKKSASSSHSLNPISSTLL